MATSSPDSTRGPGNPSWYDLLGVDDTASRDEIKAAWQAATADRDPTDRRFKLANQAAEVLLDDERRAAYDAALAERAAVEAEQSEPADETDETGETDEAGVTAAAAAGAGPAAAAAVPATTPSATPGAALAGLRAGSVPTWAVVALAVVTLAVAGLTAYLWSTPSDSEIEDSTRAAQAAAERAIVPILSYDYRSLEDDGDAARSYMTSDYKREYDKLFAVLEQNAPGTRTVVDVEVVASGIVRSGEDRVEVLVFVDRPTTNKQNSEPVVYKDQVRVQLVKVDDEWLVDCLITTPGASCE